MVDIPEFAAPDFLQNQDEDTIHSEMLDSLPADMDKGEGGFPWDLTRPTAIQNAKLMCRKDNLFCNRQLGLVC